MYIILKVGEKRFAILSLCSKFFLHTVIRFLKLSASTSAVLDLKQGLRFFFMGDGWAVAVVQLKKHIANCGCIDSYLYQLIVYHFHRLFENDKDQLVILAFLIHKYRQSQHKIYCQVEFGR